MVLLEGDEVLVEAAGDIGLEGFLAEEVVDEVIALGD